MSQTQHHAMLRIEYDGTAFCGWSRQPNLQSIEESLLNALAERGCTDVEMRCAGRTDAGVHASAQIVSMHYTGPISAENIGYSLQGALPREMSVIASTQCAPEFDARRHATSRAYEYRVLTRRMHSPIRADRVLHHPRALDLVALDEAAAMLRGRHDFTAFTPARTEHRFFHRTLYESQWRERGDELVYCVRGNAFVRHQVRVMVGTMLAIARAEYSLADLEALLAGSPRSEAANTAPPHALCLIDVTYEPIEGLAAPSVG